MVKGKIVEKVLNGPESISADRSRCLRMRFSGSPCSICTGLCRSGALAISDDVRILAATCSECMLCVAACPSDCFEIEGLDFYSVIGSLRKVQSLVRLPVLGCNARTDASCHVKTPCFGFLSDEHILALSVFLSEPVQIDLTGCRDCSNGFISEILEKRIETVETRTSIPVSATIKPVTRKSDLIFHEISYDRRGFFKTLRNVTLVQAAGLFGNDVSGDDTRSYSAKKLPLKRGVLNRVLEFLQKEEQEALLKHYYYTATVDGECDNCFACIGMCPTGALKIETMEDARALVFSTSLCNGCGLCESFCLKKSVSIAKGYSGDSPFEFCAAKKEPLCTG